MPTLFSSLATFIREEDDGTLAATNLAYRAYVMPRTAKHIKKPLRALQYDTLYELQEDLEKLGLNTNDLRYRLLRWWYWRQAELGHMKVAPYRKPPELRAKYSRRQLREDREASQDS